MTGGFADGPCSGVWPGVCLFLGLGLGMHIMEGFGCGVVAGAVQDWGC